MPFDGSGGFIRVMNWTNDALAGIKIKSDRHDEEDNNLAAGLSNTITKDGQTQPTADIPLNGKKLTNVGQPIDPQDAATKNYADAIRNFTTGLKLTGTTADDISKAYIGFVEADMSIVARTGPDRIVFNDKVDGTGTDIRLAPATALTESIIVNGAMQITQENGTTAGTASGYYAVDEWVMTRAGVGIASAQRVQSNTPMGSDNRLRLVVTTADTSLTTNDHLLLRHRIEGQKIEQLYWGTPSAKPLLLRFWLRAPAGTYGVSVRNMVGSTVERAFVRLITVSAEQSNTAVEWNLTFPGDTVGTWSTDNSTGIDLDFAFASGPLYVAPSADNWHSGNFISAPGATNGLATVGNLFDLMDVGAYVDWDGTGVPPPWQVPFFDETMQRCQRYYQKAASRQRFNAAGAGSQQQIVANLPTPMRTSPTFTSSPAANVNVTSATIGAWGDYAYSHTVNATAAGACDSALNFTCDARL